MKKAKQVLSIFLALLMLLVCAPAAFADDDPCLHTHMRYYEEGLWGQKINGIGYLSIAFWQCYDCGRYFSDEAATLELTENDIFSIPCPHSALRHLDQGEEWVTHGVDVYLCIEHWKCDKCSQWFADASGTVALTYDDVYCIPCPHSKMRHHAEREDCVGGFFNIEYWYCPVCMNHFSDEAGTTRLTYNQIYIIPCPNSDMEHHVAGELFSGGYSCVEHWYCNDCNRYFADEAGTVELTHSQVYSIPCQHKRLYSVNGTNAICGKNGSIDHWYCPDCYQSFADEAGTMVLTHDEVYSVIPTYSEHNVLYDLTFEESADRCWVSPGLLPLSMCTMVQGKLLDTVVDRQNGTVSGSTVESVPGYGELTITYVYSFKYCAHCGGYCELREVVTNSDGYLYDEVVESFGLDEFLCYLHQPGPVENDLVGYTEMPTSNDDAVFGETYFDLDAWVQDVEATLNTSDLAEEQAVAVKDKLTSYLLTARVYISDDKSQRKLVFSDDYIMDNDALSSAEEVGGIIFANYLKTGTNTCDHNWDDGVVTKEATCTEDGVKTFTCSKCKTTKTQSVLASGHSWDNGVVTKLATETETGVCTYTCTACKKTRTEIIPKLAPTKLLEEINAKPSLKDTSDDGTVFFDESANLPADTVFDFNVLEKTDWYEIFNLKLTSGGKEVEPESPVWVKIPVPAGWPSEGITVWHGMERLPSFVENGYIYFYTSHFSDFQFKYDKQTQQEDEPTPQPQPDNPQPQQNANRCHWCGKEHNGFFQKIIGFFHNIMARIFGNKY